MCSFVLALRCALLNLPFSEALIWQFSVSANYGSRSRLLRPRALWTALHRLAAPCRHAARYRPGHPQHAPGAGAHLPGDADPKWVVAVGDCAADGGIFAGSYAVAGGVNTVVPVDLHISGCPPTPRHLPEGLLALLETQCLT
jgi:hypothetical protein